MNKALLHVAIFAFTAVNLVIASGTFVFPPTPKIRRVVDSTALKRGDELFKKVFNNNLSCHSCHSKQSEFKFRRRKLRKVINKLAEQVKKCSISQDRLALSESIGIDPIKLESIQLYLAKQWKLTDYLKK